MSAGRGLKIENEYSYSLGQFYEDTPKAVFAALALSLAHRCVGMGGAVRFLVDEWKTLHANGIVPQSPPKA